MKKIILGLILVGAALICMSSMVFHNRISNETFTTGRAVKTLVIDDRNMPVEIIGVSGNKTKISYKKSKDIKYTIKQISDTLSLERKKNFGFLSINFNFFSFGNKNPKVIVEVPKTKLAKLDVETTNGQVSAKNLELDNLDIETSNSKMTITDVDSHRVDAETSNGKVELTRMTFEEGSFETSNSKMNLSNLSFTEADFQTSNGKISLMNLKPSESISLKTSNGKVDGTIIGDKNEFSTEAKTSNGSNNLENQGNGSKELEVKTSNGDIEILFVR